MQIKKKIISTRMPKVRKTQQGTPAPIKYPTTDELLTTMTSFVY